MLTTTEISRVLGDEYVKSVDVVTGDVRNCRQIECAGVFVFIGAKPHTEWLPKSIALDQQGFVQTGAALREHAAWPLSDSDPGVLETSRPGIFAAGDVRSGSVKRVNFAVGGGAAFWLGSDAFNRKPSETSGTISRMSAVAENRNCARSLPWH